MAEVMSTLGKSTLGSGYTAGSGSIVVASASSFPATPTFSVRLNNGAIYTVASVSGTTFGITLENGSDTNVSSGADVVEVVTSRSLQALITQTVKIDAWANRPTSPSPACIFHSNDGPYEQITDGSNTLVKCYGRKVTVPGAASGWTAAGTSGSIDDTTGPLIVKSGNTLATGDHNVIYYKTLSKGGSGQYTIEAGFNYRIYPGNNYNWVGIAAYNSSSTAFNLLGIMVTGGWDVRHWAAKYNNPGSFNGDYIRSGDGWIPPSYYRIVDDGTNLWFLYGGHKGERWWVLASSGHNNFVNPDSYALVVGYNQAAITLPGDSAISGMFFDVASYNTAKFD